MVLGQGLLMAALGVTAGLLLALGLLPLIASLLYGVAPLDPPTMGAVCVLLMAVALAGSVAPARRAAGIDPAALLRK